MRYTVPIKLRRFITLQPAPIERREFIPAIEDPSSEEIYLYEGLEPCWSFAKRNNAGYGQLKFNGKTWNTHRLAYHLRKGKLPLPGSLAEKNDTDILDHLCEYRPCCNPAHLEKITQSENVKRGARHR